MRIVVWIVGLALAGCYQDGVTCGDVLCPSGKVCAPDARSCVSQSQLDACHDAVDGASCSYPGTTDGVCYGTVCIPAGCGNGVVEPGEVCDDGNRVSLDGCRSDCQSLERCGDGISELALGELCDCGVAATAPANCNGPNSLAPGATCRPDCTLARCGDAIVDLDEQCDDGNKISGDGCRADCAGRFDKVQLPTGISFDAIWMTDPTSAYAVGIAGTVLAYANHTWSVVRSGNEFLTGVWGTSPTNVYVSGYNLAYQGVVLHYDGASWTSVVTGGLIWEGIWGSSASDIYVVGTSTSGPYGTVSHYDGMGWSPLTTCSGPDRYNAVGGSSASNVFVGGVTGLCRFDGSVWSWIDSQQIDDVTQVSATDVVALSSQASTFTRWRGATSQGTVTVPGYVVRIGPTAPDELLAIGPSGLVLSYTDPSWTHLVTPTEVQLNGIAATSKTNVFIVGGAGTMLH